MVDREGRHAPDHKLGKLRHRDVGMLGVLRSERHSAGGDLQPFDRQLPVENGHHDITVPRPLRAVDQELVGIAGVFRL